MSPEPAAVPTRATPPAPRISRILALRLPWWPTERLVRQCPKVRTHPFVTVGETRGRQIITAANSRAIQSGLAPGMPLADGRAIVPGVVVRPADPAADARALERLARWANRFTPRVMPDGIDTIFLDIAGCTRLFGGEKALVASLRDALEDFGLTVRLALANTPGAAWALAHYGAADPAVDSADTGPSGLMNTLGKLPVAALRLSDDVAAGLDSFGLRTVHALSAMESVKLIRRFGMEPVRRLQQALGHVDEPIIPLRPLPPREARRAFAEPISTASDIRAAVDGLLNDLCLELGRTGEGARRLHLVCHRVDGDRRTLTVGTSRPLRRKKPLMGLFTEKLEQVEPGFGIDEIVLATDMVETVDELQIDWAAESAGGYRTDEEEELADLLDRLGNRLGFGRIGRPVPRESWLPERGVWREGALEGGSIEYSRSGAQPGSGGHASSVAANWPEDRRRPLRLLSSPEPVEVLHPHPGCPPLGFRYRGRFHQLRTAEGPERLECEWWRGEAPRRDYYLAEDEDGCRHWLFREGGWDPEAAPRWFLHGVFG